MNQPQEGAVLFVDVSGSTKLYDTVGDTLAVATIDRCISLFIEKSTAVGGRVIKTIGDEVMAIFPSAEAAADAAIEIQCGIDALPQVQGHKLGVRIGFHYGPVVEKDDDVFGDTVNLAARLTGLATKGQIITSRETVDRMNPLLRSACRQLYSIPVKGKAQEVRLCEVLWQQSEDATTVAAGRTVSRSERKVGLKLRYGGLEIVMGPDKSLVTMGRDQASDLVIADRMASRTHGKIELRGDKFVLIDHSANGTFFKVDGDKEIVLRREELIMHGKGVIAFGQSSANNPQLLEFDFE
jgi:class 3 adenylate cyclase